jgi:hypothetical protein
MLKQWLMHPAVKYVLLVIVLMGLAVMLYGGFGVIGRTRELQALSAEELDQATTTERRELMDERQDSLAFLGGGIVIIAVGWALTNAVIRYRG